MTDKGIKEKLNEIDYDLGWCIDEIGEKYRQSIHRSESEGLPFCAKYRDLYYALKTTKNDLETAMEMLYDLLREVTE